MQKLEIVSQFMGVKPCSIELNKFLVLIGEQASGKSTISKLIYFFQTLPEAIIENARLAAGRSEKFSFFDLIGLVLRDKFYETFGSTYHHTSNFDIIYYYDNHESVRIYRKDDRKAYSDFSQGLNQRLTNNLKKFLEAWKTLSLTGRDAEITLRSNILRDIYNIFALDNTDFNYVIAGRSLVVGFPELFEGRIRFEIERLVEDAIKRQKLEQKRRVGNERLLLKFVEWSETARNFFKNNGGSFESVAQILDQRPKLNLLGSIFYKILKGKYDNDAYGEVIKISEREKVFLKDASNGQQEILRVLQILFLAVGMRNRKQFFVIEEPEAHLYPLSQKELINAFAVFLNTIPQGKLVVTTHSPYILACVNILLFAQYVSKTVPLQKDSTLNIPKSYWLDSSGFNAYSLGQNEAYCVNIKDPETGLIDQNYLDTISEELGLEYQALYNLLTQESA
jgi:energy-coupling factor transporter ATP-binding protein EcfA2